MRGGVCGFVERLEEAVHHGHVPVVSRPALCTNGACFFWQAEIQNPRFGATNPRPIGLIQNPRFGATNPRPIGLIQNPRFGATNPRPIGLIH